MSVCVIITYIIIVRLVFVNTPLPFSQNKYIPCFGERDIDKQGSVHYSVYMGTKTNSTALGIRLLNEDIEEIVVNGDGEW